MAGSDFIRVIELARRREKTFPFLRSANTVRGFYNLLVPIKKRVVQPLFEVSVPSCANSLAPAKRPGVTQK